jgi:RHS repeat-associated protein
MRRSPVVGSRRRRDFSTKERDYGIKDGDYEYKSGLLCFGARSYSPETARWPQTEPTGIVDRSDLNIYAAEEPRRNVDMAGLLRLA